MGNEILMKARQNKNDEFYTLYKDIQNELEHYVQFFENKNIYLPADTEESNFWLYFLTNFTNFKINKLGRSSIHNDYSEANKNGTIIKSLTNGNFFSEEVKEIMRQYDLIITNPPFSVLKDFIFMLHELNLKYILVANENVLVSTKIFPLVKDEIIHTGYTKIKEFNTPEGIQKFGNIIWITNLPIERQNPPLPLSKYYDPNLYPKYENYDAINVNKLKDIPLDYNGVMGVPITYLSKHAPSQFKILGYAGGTTKNNGLNFDVPYIPHPDDRGGNGMVNGIRKYGRIFIQKV